MNIGDLLENKYKLEKLIDANILSGLYLATNIKSKRAVLINFLPYDSCKCVKDKFFDKFFIEHDTNPALGRYHWEYTREYPNIFITNFGETPKGQAYLVLEYVDSPTLTETIEQNPQLSVKQRLKIGLQICDVILRVNSLGVIYRNINPETIMVNLSNNMVETKALDFDIDINKLYSTKQIELLSSTLGVNQPQPKQEIGFIGASLAFMTPEQAVGSTVFYPQADIYAMGILLYFILTGEYPFKGNYPMKMILQHISVKPAPLTNYPGISQEIDNTIQRALDKRPEYRHRSFLELTKELSKELLALSPNAKPHAKSGNKTKSTPKPVSNSINNSNLVNSLQPIEKKETNFFQAIVGFFSNILGKNR